jgi:GDSL-like lipase/acylhydrolase family protein
MRLVVFGDSIAAGMGARGRAFPILLAEQLEIELINFAGTASPVGWTARHAGEVRSDDLVLVAHGSTEAILRPTDRALRLVPKRWRKPGWLDPRPYFSSRSVKRLGQRVESGARWRVKGALMRIFGATQWHTPERYEDELAELIVRLPRPPIVLGTLPLDDRYFPGSRAEVERYSKIGARVARRHGSKYVDLTGVCDEWEDFCADHFHPNVEGHKKISQTVRAQLGTPVDEGGRPASI